MSMKCYNCKYFAQQDSGYSNWTVMECFLTCLKGKYKDIEDSYPREEAQFFKQFNNCEHFKPAEMYLSFDVDGETTIEDFKEDEEVYNLLKENGFE